MQSTSEKNVSNLQSGTDAVLQDGKETANKAAAAVDEKDVVYPTGLKLALLMVSLLLSVFLVSLDRLIIATAIPEITNEFKSAGDIGWYGAAYLLTSCAFQLPMGKLYTVFPIKYTFMATFLVFEIGSAICGAAPNSIVFIVGRAIAGVGGGGVLSGFIIIIAYTIPLHKRPKYQGFFGAVFALSSIAGPLVGGAFTTHVSWRWCFYVNLPVGAAATALVFVLLNTPPQAASNKTLREKVKQLNALGILFLVPSIVSLCLALQWGGTLYAWNNGRIIALIVLFIVLFGAFVGIQIWKPDQATLPPRVFTQRSVISAFFVSCCLGSHLNMLSYYLPLWFQAIRGDSAVDSGFRLLPMLISVVVATIASGLLISRVGYYTPFLIFGVCFGTIGAGLLTTVNVGISLSKVIGFQIIYGFGTGTSSQVPNVAAQTTLPKDDVAIGASLIFFGQLLFGAIFTSVGQNVLGNQLLHNLRDVPGITSEVIQFTGATDLLNRIPAEYRNAALAGYNSALRTCFQVGLIMCCISVLCAGLMEWKSVKKDLPAKKTGC